jgi:hypothetical protein
MDSISTGIALTTSSCRALQIESPELGGSHKRKTKRKVAIPLLREIFQQMSCLVSLIKLFYLSKRMFGHMYVVLNINKNN